MATKKATKKNNVKNTNAKGNATHDIISVSEGIVENGIDYGTPNVKAMRIITVYKNNDFVTEDCFFINGYKFRMDDMMRLSMKLYLLKTVPTYSKVADIDRVLSENVSFKIGSDAPQYLKIRMKQLTVLVKGLIKALRNSDRLEADILKIFGKTELDNVLDDKAFNGQLVINWKAEWRKDYPSQKYKIA